MEHKETLTNEQLRKKFISQFELVNYAIRLAENMIKSGRAPRVKLDTQNAAMQILAEISAGKDQFEEIKIETANETFQRGNVSYNGADSREDREKKHPETKKMRKILS
jgi:hypothetical protein